MCGVSGNPHAARVLFSFRISEYALDEFEVITLKIKNLMHKRSNRIKFCLVKCNFPLRHLQSSSFG